MNTLRHPAATSIRCCMILALLLLLPVLTANAYRDHRGRKVDSLEAVLSSGRPLSDKELLGAYIELINGYQNTDGDKTVDYARKALALSYETNSLNAREGALYHLGLTAYGRDDYDVAVDYFMHALAVTDSMRGDKRYTETDIDDNLSQLYGALGNLYNIQDKALLAIEYYQRALPIFERHGWLESQCILHHNVAELYLSMGNNEKAQYHYEQAIALGEKSGDSLMMALPRKGLSKILLDGTYEEALPTVTAAYNYYHAHRSEEPSDYSDILVSMARLNMKSGHCDLAKARTYIMEALPYAESGQLMTETACDVYAAAAELSIAEKQWQQALAYALKSIRPEDEATLSDVGCYQMLAQIYMELGNKEQAYTYINKVRAIQEEMATRNYQSALSQMEVLYETEQKQQAIEQLTREKRWYLWGGTLTLAVVVLLALLFFMLWRSVRLSRKTALIQAKLEGELGERVRLSRDLHDRLGGLLTNIRILSEQERASASLQEKVDEAISEMRNVAHHLLPDSLRRYGLRVALRDYCQTMKNVSFSFVGEERHVAHEEAVYCMVYELVNNAVKNSGAQHIRVQLLSADDYTVVNVSDDGKGLPADTSTTGSGLQNIRSRVEAIGGRMDLRSVPGEGTEVNIELPTAPSHQ